MEDVEPGFGQVFQRLSARHSLPDQLTNLGGGLSECLRLAEAEDGVTGCKAVSAVHRNEPKSSARNVRPNGSNEGSRRLFREGGRRGALDQGTQGGGLGGMLGDLGRHAQTAKGDGHQGRLVRVVDRDATGHRGFRQE